MNPAIRVLAHFTPGPRVTEFLAPLTDLVDVRFCAADDDATFYRELPVADVLWHVLRPVSSDDLKQGRRLKLVRIVRDEGSPRDPHAVTTAIRRSPT